MATKRAKTLTDTDIAEALAFVGENSHQPERDRLFIILSCNLGLRSQEIARLYVEDVTDARGALSDTFFVSKRAAKYGKARSLMMNSAVRDALRVYLAKYPLTKGPMFHNQFGDELSPNAVQKQLARIYELIGLKGCSSHSGRRTFGTRIARKAAEMGGTLKDVMSFMGHADVRTTEIYVDYSPRQADIMTAVWGA